MPEQNYLPFFDTKVYEGTTKWHKKTGFKQLDYHAGYRGEQFSPYCFQRQLRDEKDTGHRAGLDGEVRRITYQEAKAFILQYEWLGSMGTTYVSYGFFVDRKLTCVLCFGTTAATHSLSEPFGEKWKKQGLVLVRGACAPWAHEHTASHVIGKALPMIRELGYRFVIAYSDPEAGEIGTVYQATNWNFYGLTGQVTYLVRPDGKRIDDKRIRDDAKRTGKTNAEIKKQFIEEGFQFMKGSRKLKYMKVLGTRRDQKEILKDCQVEFYPYLKRRDNMQEVYDDYEKTVAERKAQKKSK